MNNITRHVKPAGGLFMPIAFTIALAVIVTACQKDGVSPESGKTETQIVPMQDTLRGVITENTLLVNNRTWYIDGLVYISNEVTLTVEQGTVVKIITNGCQQGEVSLNTGLIVTRGSKLVARGTAERPILFTVTDSTADNGRGWCGVMILGRAPVKKLFALPGNIILPAGNGLMYGGDLPHDSSGVLQHVRLDYVSHPANKQEKIQDGLLLLGTGSRTIVKDIIVRPAGEANHLRNAAKLP